MVVGYLPDLKLAPGRCFFKLFRDDVFRLFGDQALLVQLESFNISLVQAKTRFLSHLAREIASR